MQFMATDRQNKPDSNRASTRGGFTLVELLVVLAIMAILATLVLSAFNSIGDSQNFGSEVSDFQQTLDDARAYAMANNTFVFVGIEEVDASQPTSATPQNLQTGNGQTAGGSGNGGRIAVAVVTTTDGTSDLGPKSSTVNPNSNYALNKNVTPISKLRLFPNLHLAPDYYMGSYDGVSATSPSPLANRATLSNSYSSLGYNANYAATDTSNGLTEYFTWPLSSTSASSSQYTFNRIIQYSPDGSASLVRILGNGGTKLTFTPAWLEIDFEQMHGYSLTPVTQYSAVNNESLNQAVTGNQVAAIQIDGITGTTQVYQQ